MIRAAACGVLCCCRCMTADLTIPLTAVWAARQLYSKQQLASMQEFNLHLVGAAQFEFDHVRADVCCGCLLQPWCYLARDSYSAACGVFPLLALVLQRTAPTPSREDLPLLVLSIDHLFPALLSVMSPQVVTNTAIEEVLHLLPPVKVVRVVLVGPEFKAITSAPHPCSHFDKDVCPPCSRLKLKRVITIFRLVRAQTAGRPAASGCSPACALQANMFCVCSCSTHSSS